MTGWKQVFIPGTPAPQGSKRLLAGRMVEANPRTRVWRNDIRNLLDGYIPQPGPVAMHLQFCFLRPRSHFGTGGNAHTLRAKAPEHHTQTPDLDKLVRAVLDACTDYLFVDDRQVCTIHATRDWVTDPQHVGLDLAWHIEATS